MKTKKKNPRDATDRNVRAANTRFSSTSEKIKRLTKRVHTAEFWIEDLLKRVMKLESLCERSWRY